MTRLIIVGGGQDGADIGGWKAAKAAGHQTDGWMPRGFITESGRRPEYAKLYGAREHSSSSYPDRRMANLELTAELGGPGHGLAVVFDATPGDKRSPGTQGLYNDWGKLMKADRPCPAFTLVKLIRRGDDFTISPRSHDPEGLAWAIDHVEARALLVAGNRESSAPGIGAWVEAYMSAVFAILKAEPLTGPRT